MTTRETATWEAATSSMTRRLAAAAAGGALGCARPRSREWCTGWGAMQPYRRTARPSSWAPTLATTLIWRCAEREGGWGGELCARTAALPPAVGSGCWLRPLAPAVGQGRWLRPLAPARPNPHSPPSSSAAPFLLVIFAYVTSSSSSAAARPSLRLPPLSSARCRGRARRGAGARAALQGALLRRHGVLLRRRRPLAAPR